MASPGNQHCVSCIGTLSFPVAYLALFSNSLNQKLVCLLSICNSYKYYIYMFRRLALMEYSFW